MESRATHPSIIRKPGKELVETCEGIATTVGIMCAQVLGIQGGACQQDVALEQLRYDSLSARASIGTFARSGVLWKAWRFKARSA